MQCVAGGVMWWPCVYMVHSGVFVCVFVAGVVVCYFLLTLYKKSIKYRVPADKITVWRVAGVRATITIGKYTMSITIDQVRCALYNGNHKKQPSGNVPQGLHSIADSKAVDGAEKVPAGVPENCTHVFVCSGNVVCYVADKKLFINTSADAHLTDIQKACVDYLTTQAGGKCDYVAIEWQGRAGNGADKEKALAGKVSALFN